jgi:4-alpha-glucanotransferase
LNDSACASGAIPDATSAEAPIEAVLAFVGSTPAPLVLIPMEDLLGAHEQPNFPGTIDSHPNWRRRFSVDVEHLLFQPAVLARMARLKNARAALAPKSSRKMERRIKDRP